MNLFATPEYLAVFAKNFCRNEDIVDGIWERFPGGLILLGMKPVLGEEEVTDFGPAEISGLPVGFSRIQLDYTREDSRTRQYLKSAFAKSYGETKQEVSPFIDLPASWKEYLAGLERRQRKEIKRKFKRLEEVNYEFAAENNPEEFFRLHRLSDPHKNKFMSRPMEAFFRELLATPIPGWEKHLDFLKIDGQYAAATVSFISQDEWWLYNSGYDPQFNYFSPGVVLKAQTIRLAIAAGKKKYDFLRGSERYKYDLGAKDLPLYRIELSQ